MKSLICKTPHTDQVWNFPLGTAIGAQEVYDFGALQLGGHLNCPSPISRAWGWDPTLPCSLERPPASRGIIRIVGSGCQAASARRMKEPFSPFLGSPRPGTASTQPLPLWLSSGRELWDALSSWVLSPWLLCYPGPPAPYFRSHLGGDSFIFRADTLSYLLPGFCL